MRGSKASPALLPWGRGGAGRDVGHLQEGEGIGICICNKLPGEGTLFRSAPEMQVGPPCLPVLGGLSQQGCSGLTGYMERVLSNLCLKSLTTTVHLFHIKTGISGFTWGGWMGGVLCSQGHPCWSCLFRPGDSEFRCYPQRVKRQETQAGKVAVRSL